MLQSRFQTTCQKTLVDVSSDTQVTDEPAFFYGYVVKTVTAVAAVQIKDGDDASGTVFDTVPSGTVATTVKMYDGVGVLFEEGIFVDGVGSPTGEVYILWRPMI